MALSGSVVPVKGLVVVALIDPLPAGEGLVVVALSGSGVPARLVVVVAVNDGVPAVPG